MTELIWNDGGWGGVGVGVGEGVGAQPPQKV